MAWPDKINNVWDVPWVSDKTLPAKEVRSTIGWEIEKTINPSENVETNLEIPEELADFRKMWEEKINLPDDKKKAIIKAVKEIQKGSEKEKDWSILVEFELWSEVYQSLDVNLSEHSDTNYLIQHQRDWKTKNEVMLDWMIWDDTNKRGNKSLGEYVGRQKNRGLKIRTEEYMKNLLNKLWDKAGLTNTSDKIAMWMYLTWNYGVYWLTAWKKKKSSRSTIYCEKTLRWFISETFYLSARLCLIGKGKK